MFTRFLDTLTYPHGIERYVEIVRPTFSLRDVRARVTSVHRPTASSVALTLRPNGNWEGFRPGQFVNLTVEIDGVRHTRCYSPAGSAHDAGTIELIVKRHREGRVSRFLYANARPGLVVGLSQADGDFFLPAERPRRIQLISGGSGITPVLSMLRTLRAEGYDGHTSFLHFCRDESELATAVPARFTATAGRLTAQDIDPQADVFACGPPALLDAVREMVAPERLHVESFLPPALAPATPGEGAVTLARSGLTVKDDGRPLLEQAEAAGLAPEHGCRMGICKSCTCAMTAGSVRNLRTGAITAGTELIQICVSAPVGDVTLNL
jgi:ferredoxin-NADP reductase